MRKCCKCGCEINGNGLGNRIKSIGGEAGWTWFFRHIRQCFSLIFHGFVKPEIENYNELCDDCFKKLQIWLHTSEKAKG